MIDNFINLKIMSHPVNWLIVWLVLIFAGLAWMLIHEAVNSIPIATQEQN